MMPRQNRFDTHVPLSAANTMGRLRLHNRQKAVSETGTVAAGLIFAISLGALSMMQLALS
ncbi:MAG: hypothetical protein CL534_26160 [Ahrensia sp.]|nr:hypothetical protein [Ahrensia sp.]